MVQFGGIGGHAFRGRLVEFRGDVATTRDFDVAWSALEGLSPLLREFCAKPVEISAVFDTADSWTHLTLDVMFNEQHNCVHLVMMASGVEGSDTRLFDQIVTTVEGLVPAKPPE
jgi:hypothetical protein